MDEHSYKQALRMISSITQDLIEFTTEFALDPSVISRQLKELAILQDVITDAYIAEDD